MCVAAAKVKIFTINGINQGRVSIWHCLEGMTDLIRDLLSPSPKSGLGGVRARSQTLVSQLYAFVFPINNFRPKNFENFLEIFIQFNFKIWPLFDYSSASIWGFAHLHRGLVAKNQYQGPRSDVAGLRRSPWWSETCLLLCFILLPRYSLSIFAFRILTYNVLKVLVADKPL